MEYTIDQDTLKAIVQAAEDKGYYQALLKKYKYPSKNWRDTEAKRSAAAEKLADLQLGLRKN